MSTKNELIRQEILQIKSSLKIFVEEISQHEDQSFILLNIKSLVKRLEELRTMEKN